MSRTITDLNSQVEELEKRIKAISTSQTTLSQIIAIRDSLDQVKACLSDLNSTIEEKNQQDQENDITTIKNRVSAIETDITSLQTGVGANEDDIDTIQTEISSINSSISEQNTIISNLQTTQTNLTTTQASLISANTNNITTNTTNIAYNSSQLSQLTSRVVACEQELEDLSGGVDLSDISNKLDMLSNLSTNVLTFEQFDYQLAPANTFNTRFYYFTAPKKSKLITAYTITYTTTNPTGNMTIELTLNDSVVYTKTISLSKYPDGYKFEYLFVNKYMTNTIRLKFTYEDYVKFDNMIFSLQGTQVNISKYDQEITAISYNNYIYITKHCKDKIYYGKFTSDDTIDFDNLPNEQINYDANLKYLWMCFVPYCTYNTSSDTNHTAVYDGIIKEAHDGYKYFQTVPYSETKVTRKDKSNFTSSGEHCSGRYRTNITVYVKNDMICYDRFDDNTAPYLMSYYKSYGSWIYAAPVNSNFFTQEGNAIEMFLYLKTVAKLDDGYFYYIDSVMSSKPVKVAKGNRATAYLQSNGQINVYLSRSDGSTDKYSVIKSGTTYYPYFMCNIPDCDVVFETLNNKIIKHTSSGWETATLNYVDN